MIESAEEFRALRLSENPDEYNRAAYEEAPLQVWLDIITRMPDMRRWVAHNKTVPIAVLERLAEDPDERVRYWVAQKRKLPESLQLRLTKDPSPSVRVNLAYNAKVTARVLEVLANDPDEWIRTKVEERIERAS